MELEIVKVEVCELIVFGIISNASKEEILSEVMVTVYNSNKTIVSREVTEELGSYLFKVPLIDNYHVVYKKEGYKTQEFSIADLDKTRNQIHQLDINFEIADIKDDVEKKRKHTLKSKKNYELV